MKILTISVLILLGAATAYAAPIDLRSQRETNQRIQEQRQHHKNELKRDWEKYGTGPIPPKIGSPDWIQQTFGDQKVKKNQQAYKKYLNEKAKKDKAKKITESKGKVKK